MRVAAMEDLQQRPAPELRMLVGLHEPAWSDTGPQPGTPGVPDRLDRALVHRPVLDVRVRPPDGEQPQEVRLPGAVGAENGDALAVPDLEVEGLHQSRELQPLADHGALAGAPSPQPHGHLLLTRDLLRRARL